MKKRLLAVLILAAALVIFGGQTVQAQKTQEEQPYLKTALQSLAEVHERATAIEQVPLLVTKDQYGNAVGMLPPVSSLPSVSMPAMPVDAVRPSRPTAPQAPLAAKRPPAPTAPASPQAPKPPVETATKGPASPKNYPRGEVVADQAKRLYLDGRPVGEIRALKGRLKGELVNVDQNNLHIHIWPGPYSRIAIPVDRGQYKIAYATGKGWVISPEKTNKVPAGCAPVQIGD